MVLPVSNWGSVVTKRPVNIMLLLLVACLLPCIVEAEGTESNNTVLKRFVLEEPSYFAIGAGTRKWGTPNSFLTDPGNQAKFRLALRMLILPLTEQGDGFYFLFTEEALWNPFDGRSASLDNRYTPEFIGWWNNGIGQKGMWYRPAVGLSYTHQSNGLMGDMSRSWNRAMLRFAFGDVNNAPLLLTLKSWLSFSVDHRMPDLEDYVGEGEVLLIVQPLMRSQGLGADVLGLSLRSGITSTRRTFSNLEATLTCNAAALFHWPISTMPILMLQYFVGRGESLLYYKRDTHSLRIGLVVFR